MFARAISYLSQAHFMVILKRLAFHTYNYYNQNIADSALYNLTKKQV